VAPGTVSADGRTRPYHPTVDAVSAYLVALRAQDWGTLRELLAPDVVRHGPYGDDFTDRDAYVTYLAETLASLGDYELEVHRAFGGPTRTCVELAETATVGDQRLRTEEAVVFSVTDGLITEVRVFLQRSSPVSSGG
jgi:ketosteroid isomerase-like protein